MMRIVVLTLFLCLSLTSYGDDGQRNIVTYNWPEPLATDPRGRYPVELLKLALEKSGKKYTLQPNFFVMTQSRTLRELERGNSVDVVWTMTDIDREKRLLPIRIPIERGLMGWRLLAIRDNDSERFEFGVDASKIQSLTAMQGDDWPDYQILLSNGFGVEGIRNFNQMYGMLFQGRIDYFPRAVTEIYPELELYGSKDVIIAPRWVIHYPTASYFFVKKGNTTLANDINTGLENAISDGSMRKLFLQHFGDIIAKAKLNEREVIELSNPLLSAKTPLSRPELWFDPKVGY